jgi:hypothetical protein
MHFWNAFWTIPMGVYGERKGSMPGIAMPRNAFNTINAASGATGGGMSTNLYAGGVFDLGPDEALVIESRIKVAPRYIGFQLGNLWGESLEYAQPDHLAERLAEPRGSRWRDPPGGRAPRPRRAELARHHGPRAGLPVAALGLQRAGRPQDQWPEITATKVRFDEIRAHACTRPRRMVGPDQRRREIEMRQRHVRKRYRVF